MNERKKPGPKPKCKECGRKESEGHYDDCPVGLGVPVGTALQVAVDTSSIAQAYALRVWEGQSESAPREWRVERVRQALEGQGMSMEGVELP